MAGKWIAGEMYFTNVLHFMKTSFKKAGLEGLREGWCVNPDAFRLYPPPRSRSIPFICWGLDLPLSSVPFLSSHFVVVWSSYWGRFLVKVG
jgi:hypothetical protein